MKRKLSILLSIALVLGILSGCTPPSEYVEPTPTPTQEQVQGGDKTMTIDTPEYALSFSIMGDWKEYAGSDELRQRAKTVLTSTSDTSGSTFFYVLVDKYVEPKGITFKDSLVEQIKKDDATVEFDSITDASTEDGVKIIMVYKSDGKTKVKNYQYTTISNGYVISYVYSSPELLYNIQKGYINDMINSAKFSIHSEPIAEESQVSSEN